MSKLQNICGNVVQEALTICDGNCYVDSEITKSDEISYFVTDFLKFKVGRGCLPESCLTVKQCSHVLVELRDGVENNPTLTNRLEFLKIIWPDERITGIEIDAVSGGGSIRSLKFVGTNGWLPDAAGKYTIKVEWTPENEATCTMEFDVEFFKEGNPTIGFLNAEIWTTDPWKNTYYGTYQCKNCSPASGNNFVDNPSKCKSGQFNDFRYFEYHPTNIDNACDGGGTIQAWAIENGAYELKTFIVPENVSLDGFVSSVIYGGEIDGIQSPNDQCNIGGRLLI